MIFETLNDSNKRNELLLINNGMCHWHLRRDGQLTIREIIVNPDRQRQGIGREMLNYLQAVAGATSIFAKCPADLPANGWYRHVGFVLEGTEKTRTGKTLNLWRFQLSTVQTGTPDLHK